MPVPFKQWVWLIGTVKSNPGPGEKGKRFQAIIVIDPPKGGCRDYDPGVRGQTAGEFETFGNYYMFEG